MARLPRTLRRFRSILWTALTLVLVLAAVGSGLGKLLMPYSYHLKGTLEAQLSETLGYPVTLDGLSGEWKRFGPSMELTGLKILSDADPEAPLLSVDQAGLDVYPLARLIPGKPWFRFRISGAQLEYARSYDGEITVSGLGLDRTETRGTSANWLKRIGDLQLLDSSLTIADEVADIHARFEVDNALLKLRDTEGAVELVARLVPQAEQQPSGDLEVALRFQLLNNRPTAVSGHVAGEALDSSQWLKLSPLRFRVSGSGLINTEAWVEWSQERGLDIQGESESGPGTIRLTPLSEPIPLDYSRAQWRFQRYGFKYWDLSLKNAEISMAGDAFSTANISVQRQPTPAYQLWITADEVDTHIALTLSQALMLRRPGKARPHWLAVSMSGTASGFELLLDKEWQVAWLKAEARNITVRDWKQWPVLSGMDATIDMQRYRGKVNVRSEMLGVDWPQLYSRPLSAGAVNCDLQIHRQGRRDWQAAGSGCTVIADSVSSDADFYLESNVGRPWLKGEFRIREADLGNLDDYWPDQKLSKKIVAWLKRSLVSGTGTEGNLRIDGDLDLWPFRQAEEGLLSLDMQITDSEFDYQPDWARMTGVDGDLSIENSRLQFRTDAGQISGYDVAGSRAEVQMRAPARVSVALTGRGDASGIRQFIAESPLEAALGSAINGLNVSGPSQLTAGLVIAPGSEYPIDIQDGRVILSDAALSYPDWGFSLENISGPVAFSETGLSAESLEAVYQGSLARLSLQAERDAEERFSGTMTTRTPAQQVVPAAFLEETPELAKWLGHLDGQADWTADLAVRAQANGNETTLSVVSDLVGVKSELPAPLAKPAEQTMPMALSLPLTGTQRRIQLAFDSVASVIADVEGSGLRPASAVIQLGNALPTEPTPGTFSVTGQAARLDLDGWMDLLGDAPLGDQAQNLKPGTLSIQADSLYLMDREFADTEVTMTLSEDRWETIFNGPSIDGRIRLPETDTDALVADFNRLWLPAARSEGISLTSDPRQLPTVHFLARDFHYAGLELIDTRIEAWPRAGGLHIETAEGSSPDFNFRANGEWLIESGQERSKFNISVSAENLGNLLESLNIGGSIVGGQTLVQFDAWWPGAPSTFALSRLNGLLSVSVTDGQLINAQPGAGRLLGLLSLQALPRRLALDFRDVFDKGFAFDRAEGSFQLDNGVASTSDLEVSSAAAIIRVTGETDLAEKQYNQEITVQPGVGSTLPLIGAIAGGPGGAAAGLALQGLLQKPLGEATQVRYSITGSWNEPVVTPISVRAAVEEQSTDNAASPGAASTNPEPVVPGDIGQ